MKHTLDIQLSGVEGSVVRALGLIERRGFGLIKCSVGESDGTGRNMQVTVTSDRPGELLKHQLERLHDVYHVELLAAEDATPAKPRLRQIDTRRV